MPRFRPHTFRYAYACEVAVRAMWEGWLGRLAQDVGLGHLIDRVLDDGVAELAIWRAHHAAAVCSASPLALDLLSHHGFEPGAVALALGPNGDWRRWICGPRPLLAATMAGRWKGRPPSAPHPHDDRDAFLHGGLVIRGWTDRAGALGVRLSPFGMEVGARLGGVHLRTMGDMVAMTMGADVPETIRVAALGRRVDEVFDHPVLNGRGYIVAWSGDYDGDVPHAGERPAWRIRFRAGRVGWRVPWA